MKKTTPPSRDLANSPVRWILAYTDDNDRPRRSPYRVYPVVPVSIKHIDALIIGARRIGRFKLSVDSRAPMCLTGGLLHEVIGITPVEGTVRFPCRAVVRFTDYRWGRE